MIIKCKNANIELIDISYSQFLDNIKTESEREFIQQMKHIDNNEYFDFVLESDYKFDYISIDDIAFRRNDDFFEINHAGFGKFKINIFKKE